MCGPSENRRRRQLISPSPQSDPFIINDGIFGSFQAKTKEANRHVTDQRKSLRGPTHLNMVPVAVNKSWTRWLASWLPLFLILIMINTGPLRQVQARVDSSRKEARDGPIAAAGRRRPHGVARNASMDAAAGGVDLQSLPQLALTPYCKRGSCYYCSQCVGCCTCLAGAYCPGDDQQYPCNAGTYNPLTNQTSAAACQSCGPGKYSAVAGASACATCPINTYSQRGSGSLACVPCPWGTYTTQSGQSSASACLLNGTYTGSLLLRGLVVWGWCLDVCYLLLRSRPQRRRQWQRRRRCRRWRPSPLLRRQTGSSISSNLLWRLHHTKATVWYIVLRTPPRGRR